MSESGNPRQEYFTHSVYFSSGFFAVTTHGVGKIVFEATEDNAFRSYCGSLSPSELVSIQSMLNEIFKNDQAPDVNADLVKAVKKLLVHAQSIKDPFDFKGFESNTAEEDIEYAKAALLKAEGKFDLNEQ